MQRSLYKKIENQRETIPCPSFMFGQKAGWKAKRYWRRKKRKMERRLTNF